MLGILFAAGASGVLPVACKYIAIATVYQVCICVHHVIVSIYNYYLYPIRGVISTYSFDFT